MWDVADLDSMDGNVFLGLFGSGQAGQQGFRAKINNKKGTHTLW